MGSFHLYMEAWLPCALCACSTTRAVPPSPKAGTGLSSKWLPGLCAGRRAHPLNLVMVSEKHTIPFCPSGLAFLFSAVSRRCPSGLRQQTKAKHHGGGRDGTRIDVSVQGTTTVHHFFDLHKYVSLDKEYAVSCW